MRTLPEILRDRACAQPGDRAYAFLDEHGEEEAALTYGELHSRALAVAAALATCCRPGDRALLVFPQSLDFVAAWFGCLYAQVIAVPVAPPRGGRVPDATRGVVRDSEPAAVLTHGGLVDLLRESLDRPALEWVAVDSLPAAAFSPRPCPPDSVAFLQYTSGSTSDPKGVVVSHRNLVANQEMIRRGFGHDRGSTVVGWTPFFHDQGLIGNVLQPLYVGATGILMSPMTFLRRPLLWLTTISRYRAHTSGGPNFAFDTCVARAARSGRPDVDLSCWQVAFNGAEPIRPGTLADFAAAFGPVGFAATALHPCYGLAEATLIVAGSRKGRGPRTVTADPASLARGRFRPAARGRVLAGSGIAADGCELRIVDASTGLPCAAGEVGEIRVAGAHVTRGYWRNPAATAATFPGGGLRTGDLGVLVDGELYVVGRLKDLVIVRGQNLYPPDVEDTVQAAHPAVRLAAGAAFSVTGPDGPSAPSGPSGPAGLAAPSGPDGPSAPSGLAGLAGPSGERLVVVQEIRRDHLLDGSVDDVAGAIRAAVSREHGVSLHDLVLTLPGRLPKTSSGKIMRTAARERYQRGGFEVWVPRGAGRPVERIGSWKR